MAFLKVTKGDVTVKSGKNEDVKTIKTSLIGDTTFTLSIRKTEEEILKCFLVDINGPRVMELTGHGPLSVYSYNLFEENNELDAILSAKPSEEAAKIEASFLVLPFNPTKQHKELKPLILDKLALFLRKAEEWGTKHHVLFCDGKEIKEIKLEQLIFLRSKLPLPPIKKVMPREMEGKAKTGDARQKSTTEKEDLKLPPIPTGVRGRPPREPSNTASRRGKKFVKTQLSQKPTSLPPLQ